MKESSVNKIISTQCRTLRDVPANVKVEDSGVLLSSVDKDRSASLQLGFPALKVKKEIPEGVVDDLDHLTLKERQRMLLARYLMLIVDICFSWVGLLNILFCVCVCLFTLLNFVFSTC